jgi:hypothetical protein
MRVIALLAAAGALLALAVERLGGPDGTFSLAQARAFTDFPLYFAGEEADGLPLTAVLRRNDTADFVSFVYGDCAADSDSGCAPPAEVQVWPRGVRGPSAYDPSAPGTPVSTATELRDLPAALFEDGTRVELYGEHSTIVVFADSRRRGLAIAAALRCVRPAAVSRDGSLGC